jgi:Activator of Hsp90 ATPase homolog 1-like protein.
MDPAVTLVSFELLPEGTGTRVRLTHTGVDDFSPDNPDLKKQNFVNGWNRNNWQEPERIC